MDVDLPEVHAQALDATHRLVGRHRRSSSGTTCRTARTGPSASW